MRNCGLGKWGKSGKWILGYVIIRKNKNYVKTNSEK